MEGFIQLHRRLLEWEWYDDAPTFKLFIHCLLKANYTDKKWRGNDIKRGQFITSLASLSHETGLTLKQVRKSLDKLVKTGELGKVTSSRNTMITVLSYNNYQQEGKPKGEVRANKGQSEGKVRATTNKDNKDNKDNKEIISFDDFWNSYDKKVGNKEKIKNKWDKLSIDVQKEILSYIPKYIKAQPDKKYRKNPETFLNNNGWKDEIIGEKKETIRGESQMRTLPDGRKIYNVI